jgi:peptidoglycan/xylan/chitin deacetylase (PgdA/CDA1 family)
MMRIPGLKKAKYHLRWLRKHLVKGGLILGYHRIAEVLDDPYDICVSPKNFAEQLQILSHFTRPIRLAQLLPGLHHNHLQARSVVLTFDDGYVDSLKTVRPLLEQYGIPATIFITTGYLGKEFWWDELQRLLFSQRILPDRRSRQISGNPDIWTAINRHYEKLDKDTGGNRKQLLLSLYRRIFRLSPTERDKIFTGLRDWAGIHLDNQPTCRALSEEELRQLASSKLIDVGAHTVTHPLLPELPLTAQRREIEHSKQHLETLLERPVPFFSYPNGSWSAATEKIVCETGFEGACGSHNDIVWTGSNRFYLPRFWINNQDGESFSSWLHRWLKK